MQEWKRTCERREALTIIHGGHCRHVPAANVLVERNRIIEHCRKVPHAPQGKHKTHHTNRRTRPGQSSKNLRTDSRGKVSTAIAVGPLQGREILHLFFACPISLSSTLSDQEMGRDPPQRVSTQSRAWEVLEGTRSHVCDGGNIPVDDIPVPIIGVNVIRPSTRSRENVAVCNCCLPLAKKKESI